MQPTLPDYYNRINLDLLSAIKPNRARVLEIGCGAGALGAKYKEKNPTNEWWGIELDTAAAQHAAGRIDSVSIGNIEQIDMQKVVGAIRFDGIVCGDVMEHLIDPWTALKNLAALLTHDGNIYLCIPNISHWTAVCEILRGNFPYQSEGLFDKTHLRFFTKREIIKLVESAGLTVVSIIPRLIPMHQQAYNDYVQFLLPLVKAMGADADEFAGDAMSIQYVVTAAR
jgi:2-polyprenyl-3-methyl-5-hydroxy-6-metoxy-1,4-benzoquinol methylase